MKKSLLLIAVMLFFANQHANAQVIVRKAVGFRVTKPLREIKGIPVGSVDRPWKEVPNKFNFLHSKGTTINPSLLEQDQAVQSVNGALTTAVVTQNWEGVSSADNLVPPDTRQVAPPDTQGDVGPNHYVQVVNLSFEIWDKQGNSLYGPYDLSTIWDGFNGDWSGTNDGDPIVLYDQAADRWMISQFSLPHQQGFFINPPYYELVAISKTPDPTGEWYQYAFQFDDYMPDYPHLGIWPDGYYMATNGFEKGAAFRSAGATCFERDKMLVGDSTARMVYIAVKDVPDGSEAASMLPSDWDGTTTPPTGAPNYYTYFQDDSESGVPADRLRLWEFHVDWTTPANSTFTLVNTLNTAAFDSNVNQIPQKGTTQELDNLADRLMYRLQYRNFGTYQAMVTNHTVNVSGHAAVRWYEMRNTGSGWSIYQQGTYSPDSENRWMGSVALNGNGDIGLEYTVSSSNIYPEIRYTGRFRDDPLGEMTIAEGTIVAGGGSQTSPSRWGDYSMMSVDPSDDLTFWATNEYYQQDGSYDWNTRIGAISFGGTSSVLADIKVMLEGPYNGTNMDTALQDSNFIPLTSPYSEDPRTVTSIPANTVDWILVELRNDANGTAITSKSAFLRNDGMIVGDDGTSKISLNEPAGDYYIVVKHRNHLPIMSANKVTLPNSTTYDFTTSASQSYGTGGVKNLQ